MLLAYAAAGIVALFPVTPGGLGIVEASLSGLLILAGTRPAYALLATLAYRIASYWLPLLAGLPAYLLFRHRYGRPTPQARHADRGHPAMTGQPVRDDPGHRCSMQGLGQDAEHDVKVGVEVDCGVQGVGAEGADDLSQALLDGHAAGVLVDQVPDGGLVLIGDDDGGGVAAEAGDDELPLADD